MRLVVYGDFNCPYSYLASARVDALLSQGRAEVDWRAVEHDRDIPAPSEPVNGDLATELDREVDEVRGLLLPGENVPIRRPPVHPNTALAASTYAGCAPLEAQDLRRRLFAALWVDGLDIGDASTLAALEADADSADDKRAAAWQDEWLGFDRRLVPMLVLPDGYVSRGLGALKRLAEFS